MPRVTRTRKQIKAYVFSNFEEKDTGYSTPCWIWKGRVNNKGYAFMGWGGRGKRVYIHVLMKFLKTGKWPKRFTLHHCDIRNCIRPEHLFSGTAQDNTDDCIAKGRFIALRGQDSPQSKLTDAQVLEIRQRRARGEQLEEIAKCFGVKGVTVSFICLGITWRHLGGPRTRNRRFGGPYKLFSGTKAKILSLWKTGKFTQSELGRQFKVDQSAISRVVNDVW